MAALDAHQRGQLVLAMRRLDIRRRIRHPHPVGMLRRLLVNGIDQLQGAPRVVALVKVRLDPDREELRAKVALLGRVEIEIAAIELVGKVVVLVDQPLRRIGMRVDNDSGVVYSFGGLWIHRRVLGSKR